MVWMIKIEDSTVSLQDKTLYSFTPLPFEPFPVFSTSFPRRRESPSMNALYQAGTAASLHQTEDSRLRGSDVVNRL